MWRRKGPLEAKSLAIIISPLRSPVRVLPHFDDRERSASLEGRRGNGETLFLLSSTAHSLVCLVLIFDSARSEYEWREKYTVR
ncbi:hypothetical protein MRX96_001153 [Rhipicephalus microplus]